MEGLSRAGREKSVVLGLRRVSPGEDGKIDGERGGAKG